MPKKNRKRKRSIGPIEPCKKRNNIREPSEGDVANIDSRPQPDEIELLRNAATNYGGNYYKDMTASENAQVHNGAVIQINNIHGGIQFGFPPTMPSPFNSPNAREVVVATCAALASMAESCSGAKDALAYFMRLVSRLGKQLFVRVSVLEDSFGRPFKIDVDTIGNWREFESLMLLKYEGKRGQLRLQDGKYRLQSRGDTRLVNPRQRPSFAKLFAPGKYVKMTMHFGSGEVTLGCCPKCLTEQETSLEGETICEVCRFAYTTEYEGVLTSRRSNPGTPTAPGLGSFVEIAADVKIDDDRPEHFKNMSIGAAGVSLVLKSIIEGKDKKARIIEEYQRLQRQDEQEAKAEEQRIKEKIMREKIEKEEQEKSEWEDFLRRQKDEADKIEIERREKEEEIDTALRERLLNIGWSEARVDTEMERERVKRTQDQMPNANMMSPPSFIRGYRDNQFRWEEDSSNFNSHADGNPNDLPLSFEIAQSRPVERTPTLASMWREERKRKLKYSKEV